VSYAEVAVGVRAGPGRTFSYAVPQGLEVRVGHAVQVPFGPRQVPGFVFAVTAAPGYPDTREISRVIDSQPWLSEASVRWTPVSRRSTVMSSSRAALTRTSSSAISASGALRWPSGSSSASACW